MLGRFRARVSEAGQKVDALTGSGEGSVFQVWKTQRMGEGGKGRPADGGGKSKEWGQKLKDGQHKLGEGMLIDQAGRAKNFGIQFRREELQRIFLEGVPGERGREEKTLEIQKLHRG